MAAPVYTYSLLERMGRLGNQLWQVASTIGIADKNGGRAVLPETWEYRPYFSVPDEYFGRAKNPVFDPKDDWLQDLNHWEHIRPQVLEMFKPNPSIVPELNARFERINPDGDSTIAIHVRRGDYVTFHEAFPPCPTEYYRNALALARQNDPDARVVVFSDDINYCRTKMFSPEEGFIYVDGVSRHPDITRRKVTLPEDFWDLLMMSMCDQHIISNSSFSWWGATLADKEHVYYPAVWYGPKNAHINWRLMIPNGWTEVSVR